MLSRLLTSTVCLLLSGWSYAEDIRDNGSTLEAKPKRNSRHHFEQLDTNKNGTLSRLEFTQNPRLLLASDEQKEALFLRFDKNGDGEIDKNEMPIRPRKGPRDKSRFPKLDANTPLTFEKFIELPRIQKLEAEIQTALFKRLDHDSDGLLTIQDMHHRRQHRPFGKGALFAQMDKNQDERVSFSEFLDCSWSNLASKEENQTRFARLDANSDGFVDKEEIKALEQKFYGKKDAKDRGKNPGKPSSGHRRNKGKNPNQPK